VHTGVTCLKDVTVDSTYCHKGLSAPEVTGYPFCEPRQCAPLHPTNGYNNDDLESAIASIPSEQLQYKEFDPLRHDVRDANLKHHTGLVSEVICRPGFKSVRGYATSE
jgi:hypothetical protein